MQIQIDYDALRALLLVAADKDLRYYLNGIHIEVSETAIVAVATDGHSLLALPLAPCDADAPRMVGAWTLPRDVLDMVKPHKVGRSPLSLTITLCADTFEVSGQALLSGRYVDGRFPNWRMVVPRETSGTVAQFNAEKIYVMHKVNKLLGGKYSVGVCHNGENPARIMLAREDAVAVVMPMRGNASFANPPWLDNATAESRAAA